MRQKNPPVGSVEPVETDAKAKNEAAIALLRAWREGPEADEQEQREVWTYLQEVLDKDRWSDRKLFP